MITLVFLCSIAAFALLANASGTRGPRPADLERRKLRGGAWAMLLCAFALSILSDGWVFGPILWIGLVMLSAGTVFSTINVVGPQRRS